MTLIIEGLLFVLSFFSKVGKAQCCRGLIFFAASGTCDNKNNYCYKVGEHFEKLLVRKGNSVFCKEAAGNIKSAENKGAYYAEVWLPNGENNQGNGKPALIINHIFPGAV